MARGQCPAPRVSPPVISATYNNLDTALQCQISHWIKIIVAVAGTPESEDTQLSALFYVSSSRTLFRSTQLFVRQSYKRSHNHTLNIYCRKSLEEGTIRTIFHVSCKIKLDPCCQILIIRCFHIRTRRA